MVQYYYLMCLKKYYILIFLKTKLLNYPGDLDLLHKSSIRNQNIDNITGSTKILWIILGVYD